MRNFIVSSLCIVMLLASWSMFSLYSSQISNECKIILNQMTESYIPQENWISAEYGYSNLTATWNHYKKSAHIFLDSKDINEIDCALKKAHLYMQAHDISNSAGEIAYIKDKILMLHNNDIPSIYNIF